MKPRNPLCIQMKIYIDFFTKCRHVFILGFITFQVCFSQLSSDADIQFDSESFAAIYLKNGYFDIDNRKYSKFQNPVQISGNANWKSNVEKKENLLLSKTEILSSKDNYGTSETKLVQKVLFNMFGIAQFTKDKELADNFYASPETIFFSTNSIFYISKTMIFALDDFQSNLFSSNDHILKISNFIAYISVRPPPIFI